MQLKQKPNSSHCTVPKSCTCTDAASRKSNKHSISVVQPLPPEYLGQGKSPAIRHRRYTCASAQLNATFHLQAAQPGCKAAAAAVPPVASPRRHPHTAKAAEPHIQPRTNTTNASPFKRSCCQRCVQPVATAHITHYSSIHKTHLSSKQNNPHTLQNSHCHAIPAPAQACLRGRAWRHPIRGTAAHGSCQTAYTGP